MNRNAGSHRARPSGRFWASTAAGSHTGQSSVGGSAENKDGGSSQQWKLKELNADFEGLGVRKSSTVKPKNHLVPPKTNHSALLSSSFSVKEDVPTPAQKDSGSSTSSRGGDLGQSTAAKPFDIFVSSSGTPMMLKPSLLVKNREKRNEMKRSMAGVHGLVLRPGMVLLKSYLSFSDQDKIAKLCRDIGLGPGGFYQPGYRDGAKLHLKMMCLGKTWDPETSKYREVRPSDGAKPPEIPSEFHSLVGKAIRDCHSLIRDKCEERSPERVIPRLSPDICIVNFYSASGRLGLHQDRDESEASLQEGRPVVSFSIGDTAEFLYGDNRDVDKADKETLESGDVLVFGGKSRHVFHGVASIINNSAPKILLEKTKVRPGRLNLTFREY